MISEAQLRRPRQHILTALACLVFLPPVAASAAETKPTTLAVLNFSNRNPGDGWDWLETGIADMLITDLSHSSGFQVVTRENLARFLAESSIGRGVLDTAARLKELTGAMQVQYVVGGSFERKTDELHIFAHVFDAGTGELKRAEAASGPIKDVFRLEKKIATQLVDRFHVPLTAEERKLLEFVPTDNIDAAAHCYRGLDRQDEGYPFDALAELRMAVHADPGYARAGIALAQLYRSLRESGHARAQYRRVAELPDEVPESCTALMEYVRLPGDVDERVAACREVMRRWPTRKDVNSPPPLAWASAFAARLLADEGRIKEALEQVRTTRITVDFFNYGRNVLDGAFCYALDESGQRAAGAPAGFGHPVFLTRESPSFGQGGPEQRPAVKPFKTAWGWGNAWYIQADEGHAFRSLRLEAVVEAKEKDGVQFGLSRTGSMARGAYGSDVMLHRWDSGGVAGPEEVRADWPLAPGARSVYFFAGVVPKKQARIMSWKVTAELVPLGETGSVRIQCWPPGRLLIDGVAAGTTLDNHPCVPAGRHEFAVQFASLQHRDAGPENCRAVANVVAGRETIVRIRPYGSKDEAAWDDPISFTQGGGTIPFDVEKIKLFPSRDGSVHVLAIPVWRAMRGESVDPSESRFGLCYGRWRAGMSSVELLPLPAPLNAAYPEVVSFGVSLAEEPNGSHILVTRQTLRGKKAIRIWRTWDFIEWGPPVEVPEVQGYPSLVILRASLYALFLREVTYVSSPDRHTVNRVRVLCSRDQGETWGKPVTIAEWESKEDVAVGDICCAADRSGKFWVAAPVRGEIWLWSSPDLKTWTKQSYSQNVFAPPSNACYDYWAAYFWQSPAGPYCLAFVAPANFICAATSEDGKNWSKPGLFSPVRFVVRLAQASDGGVWAAVRLYGQTWLHRRRPTGAPPTERGNAGREDQ